VEAGVISAKPDMARVHVTVEEEDSAAMRATIECNDRMNAILQVMTDFGIDENDLRTSDYCVGPKYEYPENKPNVLVGYVVRHSLTVTVRDFDNLGIILNILSARTYVNSVMFDISNKEALFHQARVLAVADAIYKAKTLADKSGVVLGRPTQIVESAAPTHYRHMMAKNAVPIAGGVKQVSVHVSMKFLIGVPDPNSVDLNIHFPDEE